MEDKKTKLKIEKEDLIEENVDYVFTIKDRNILDEQGQKENEQIDVIENTYIKEIDKIRYKSYSLNYYLQFVSNS